MSLRSEDDIVIILDAFPTVVKTAMGSHQATTLSKQRELFNES